MRIREFSIDRFGMLHSQRVPDLSPGITVFFGDNEAGKSTCLNFFRAMLFGYARNRRSIDYLTDAKAVSGGNLLLDSESLGTVRLARVPGPHGGKAVLSTPEGALRPESDLTVLLRGCTPALFDKVFAFSLGELMEFSSLTDDSIRHALHGAAFGTGLRSPGQVLKDLDEAMRKIYAPRASSSKIHGLLRELDEVNATIRERGNEVDRYALLMADFAAATEELEASRTARGAMEEERRTLERTIALRRRWDALREAENALAAFPETEGAFTPDGRERLDRLAERQEDRRHSLAQARYAQERAEAERASLAYDPLLAQALAGTQTLAERKENMRAAVSEVQALQAEKDSLGRQAVSVCADLGPGWDVGRLAAMDISLAVHERCETLGRALVSSGIMLDQARNEAEKLDRDYGAARQSLTDALAALREAGGGVPEPGDERLAAGPDDADLERLGQFLIRAEDAHEKTGALALAARNAEQALEGAVAAVGSSWTRQHFERVALTPVDRERLLTLGRAVADAESALAGCERDKNAAALIHDDIAERVSMLERSLRDGLGRLAGDGDTTEGIAAGLERSASSFERKRRLLRRAQTARKSLENAQAAYAAVTDKLGHLSLVRGAREKSRFPWALIVLFLAAIFLVCGGGLLYLGLSGGHEVMARIGTGALAAGGALGLAWGALAASGASGASDAMERDLASMEQRLQRAGMMADKGRAEAETLLESLAAEAPDMFPDGAIDADSLVEGEQDLTRLREQLIIVERDAREHEREAAALGAARKRLDGAADAWRNATGALEDALAAWEETLLASCLPATVRPEEARSLLERLDAASNARSGLQTRMADKQAAEETLVKCLRFAKTLPELADALASLPEPGSHLAPEPGPWLAVVRDYLVRQRNAGRERIRLRELAAVRQSRLEEVESLRSRAGETLQTATAKAGEAQSAWAAWLESRALSPSLSPETARRALETAVKGRAALEREARIEARLGVIRREAGEFLHDLNALASLVPEHPARSQVQALADSLATASEPILDSASMAAALSLLDDILSLSRDAAEKAAVVRAGEKELPALRDAVSLAEEQLAVTKAEIGEILRLAGCDSPESYRGAHAAWAQREGALAAVRTAAATLDREAAEAGLSSEALAGTFAATTLEETTVLLAEREELLGEALSREHDLAGRKGALEAETAGLLNERGLTTLLAKRESLTGEVAASVREWSVFSAAREMLLAAKGRFESERQGGVVRYAGEIFSAVTGGAYSGITVSLADESVAAVARDGMLKHPETELSRGTREQLYLALRLAYVLDHGAQAEKLPVVMDDILVNFDDGRARRTAEVLASFAESHQVLFFTCHEKTASMLAASSSATVRYALRNGSFVRA